MSNKWVSVTEYFECSLLCTYIFLCEQCTQREFGWYETSKRMEIFSFGHLKQRNRETKAKKKKTLETRKLGNEGKV